MSVAEIISKQYDLTDEELRDVETYYNTCTSNARHLPVYYKTVYLPKTRVEQKNLKVVFEYESCIYDYNRYILEAHDPRIENSTPGFVYKKPKLDCAKTFSEDNIFETAEYIRDKEDRETFILFHRFMQVEPSVTTRNAIKRKYELEGESFYHYGYYNEEFVDTITQRTDGKLHAPHIEV